MAAFQSTPPARGTTEKVRRTSPSPADFNPRPPRGGRRLPPPPAGAGNHFNPRPPRGGRLNLYSAVPFFFSISIHAPREGDDFNGMAWPSGVTISIHAPREGDDFAGFLQRFQPQDFNPRPPRGGRRHVGVVGLETDDFNPRPPRGGRLCEYFKISYVSHISIHAPREGDDRVFL